MHEVSSGRRHLRHGKVPYRTDTVRYATIRDGRKQNSAQFPSNKPPFLNCQKAEYSVILGNMIRSVTNKALSSLPRLSCARQAGSWSISEGSMDWSLVTQTALPSEASPVATPLRDDFQLLMAVPKRKVTNLNHDNRCSVLWALKC